jgi:hypothetical protein
MSKITLGTLKKHLKQRSHDELVADIAELFTRLDAVKDYFALQLQGPYVDVSEEYKARIKAEFFPARGYGEARLSVARKAVTDYKKLGPPPASLADLMLYYVETGVRFTNTYGDINEAFYNSMVTMYQRAVELLSAHGLLAGFEERCLKIVTATRNIGWGFHDDLSDIYDEHFGASLAGQDAAERDRDEVY